jgi:hypothetical protein
MSGKNTSDEMAEWVVKAKTIIDDSVSSQISKEQQPSSGQFLRTLEAGYDIVAKGKPPEIADNDWQFMSDLVTNTKKKLSKKPYSDAIAKIRSAPSYNNFKPDQQPPAKTTGDDSYLPSPLWTAVFDFWSNYSALTEDIKRRGAAMEQLKQKKNPSALLSSTGLSLLQQCDDPSKIYERVEAVEQKKQAVEKKFTGKQNATLLRFLSNDPTPEFAKITTYIKELNLEGADDALQTLEPQIDAALSEAAEVDQLINKDSDSCKKLMKDYSVTSVKDLGAKLKLVDLRKLNGLMNTYKEMDGEFKDALAQARSEISNTTNQQSKQQKKQSTDQIEINMNEAINGWPKLSTQDQLSNNGKGSIAKMLDNLATLRKVAPISAQQSAKQQKATEQTKNKQEWSAFRSDVEAKLNSYISSGYEADKRGVFPQKGILTKHVVDRCLQLMQFSIKGRPFFWGTSQTTPANGEMKWEIPSQYWTVGSNNQTIKCFLYHLGDKTT